jgi:NitT/TauT family transport system ATP-binding protein
MRGVYIGSRQDARSPLPPGPHQTGVSISVTGVRHAFAHGEIVVWALWDFDLEIPASQFVTVVGPSGCGKTTLLAMVGGLVFPRAGEVRLDGRIVTGPPFGVAYMLARDALMPWRTVRQNVEFGLEIRGVEKSLRHERSEEWLDRVGLRDFGDARITELSQGMRQRVAIARTLALEPRCLLMDEPFAALDAQTRTLLQQEFLRLWERVHATVIFVTHDLGEAILLGDRVILVSHRPGRVVADVMVELPRPRTAEIELDDPRFREYYKRLAGQLRTQVEAQLSERRDV